MSSELPEFTYSSFVGNPTGWGPTTNNRVELEKLEGLPYQPYNRCDKIGRIVDWIGGIKKADNRYNERTYGSSATAGDQFAYTEDNDDDFQMVAKVQPQKQQFKGFRLFKHKKAVPKQPEIVDQQSTKTKRSIAKEHNRFLKQWLSRGGNLRGLDQAAKRKQYQTRQEDNTRAPSVRSNWKVIEVLDFARLFQLSLPNIGHGEDIPDEMRGEFYTCTTTDDATISKLAKNKMGNVFATDIILATLMTATRSVNSWDLIVTKVGDKLFFDKRDTDGYANAIDSLSVSETAVKPPAYNAGGINSAKDLAVEALYINQNFRRQVLKMGGVRLSISFLVLGDMSNGTPIKLVVRTENDGVMIAPDKKVQTLTIKAFNEWDSTLSGGIDWRTKIDQQKGAILATEMKNNSCKLAKWTLQAILGASDFMKLGFVSRTNTSNSAAHAILGVTQVTPGEMCNRINLI
uniref:Eukaryotic translation initiation factor 3 subunit p66 n=1 Tax=Ditylenchus dipsaci TaxID=166011 RepID=A0A915D6T5_9BILA